MAVSTAERQFILAQLERFAQTDLDNLWRQAEQLASEDFFSYMRDAFPEIADTYSQTAGQLAATWFEESDPASPYVARVADPIVRDRLIKSAEWALGGDGSQALDRMSGTLQRAVYDGARETTVLNVEATDSRFIRVARPDACPFCRMLATRTGDYAYKSKKSAGVDGRKYHDFCHCQAVEVRPNQTVDEVLTDEQRKLFQQWSDEYEKATANAGTTANTKKIMSEWRSQIASATSVPGSAPGKLDRAVLDNATTVEQVGKYISGKHGINTEGLAKPLFANGMPMEESLKRGADSISAYQASLPRVITVESAREFGQAVDDIMTKYPYLKLEEMKGDFLPYGNPLASAAHCAPKLDKDYNSVGHAEAVVLNALSDVVGKEGESYAARARFMLFEDSRYAFDARDRPVYAVMVHEMGHVVDFNGGCLARNGRAQKALCEHIATLPGAPKLDPKRVFDLFTDFNDFEREWLRENLTSAYSFEDGDRTKGVFWAEALAEAFADVELRGEKAEVASKIIHREMIAAAEESKRK